MQSKATTVKQYLSELPPDRRSAIEAVRALVLQNLDKNFEEGMQYGMIGYFVPHSFFPPGYHCDPKQPLPFAGLASQKNHMSFYIMSMYGDGPHLRAFQQAWSNAGKKLDMGKCCIRFKRMEDLALDVLADCIRGISAREYVDHYVQTMTALGKPPRVAKSNATGNVKPATKGVKQPAIKKAKSKPR